MTSKRRKWGPKITKKPAPPVSICLLFPSAFCSSLHLSTAAFSSENTNKPNLYTTTNTSSTTGSQHNHQAATATLSLFSFWPFSLLCKLLLPAQQQLQRLSSPSTPPPTSPPARPQAFTTSGGSPSLPCINRPRCSLLQSLHAEFILHAATKIISFPLWVGPVQAQPKWMSWFRPSPHF